MEKPGFWQRNIFGGKQFAPTMFINISQSLKTEPWVHLRGIFLVFLKKAFFFEGKNVFVFILK